MSTLTVAQKDIIKASVPVLETSGLELTSRFYKFMLETHPEVRPYFNPSHQATLKQPKILLFAVLQCAKNIDDLSPLSEFVTQIVTKHVGLQVKPEQYQVVGSCLLKTLKDMLGDAATPEFMKAWEVFYTGLAEILIGAEAKEYQFQSSLPNSWTDFRNFKVSKIVSESADVKSVYFKSVDGKPIVSPVAGQYICIRFKPDTSNPDFETSREYTISSPFKDDEYRISVRRVEGGIISNYVHDHLTVGSVVKIAPPSGKLVYEEGESPMVFLAGGIGITPLISITEYALSKSRPVDLLFSNKSAESRPFADWFKSIKQQYGDQFKVKEFISEESSSPKTDFSDIANRRLVESDLDFINDQKVYMLGPDGYMDFVTQILGKKGIPKSAISTENFGVFRP